MAIPGNFLSATTESIDPNTSGWKAKTNCTISLGSGGRSGDGVLAVRSVAAGEMQATTVSSYQVLPGVEYQTFADASGATVPERIGIRWMTAANTEISITWSLTTAAASSSWHRISVAGVAPANAARAYIVVSSTPAAGAVFSYYENVYFGFPLRYTGNLLSFNAESAEIDASGWTAETNGTVGRAVPVVQWPVDFYLAGGHVTTLTVTAGGNASMRSTGLATATPGTEYVASCYLSPPTSGSTAWVELRFYDSGGSQIQATRSVLAAPGVGYYRQFASAVAPAGTASCSLAAGLDAATAGQVLRIDGAVVTVAPVLQTGSILPYADASFEQGLAGWSVVSGVATMTRSSPWGTGFYEGAYGAAVTSTTATASVIRSAKFALPAGSGGQGHRLQLHSNVAAGGWTITPGIRWYDAGNNDLGLTSVSAHAVPTPGWWTLEYDLTAPAAATQAAIEYTLAATSASSTWRFDRVVLWQALPLAEVDPDDATASIRLILRELPVGDLVTIYRVTSDGSRTLVRGPDGLYSQTPITSDQIIVEDYEAPLGVPVSYYVEILEPGETVPAYRDTAAVTISPGDPTEAWLSDPGQPQRNLKVLIRRGPDWQRAIEQADFRIRGRHNSVTLSDVRAGLEGDLQVWTRSDDERTALHWLLDPGNPILWRAAPGSGVNDMYVTVGQITEARTGGTAAEPWRAWTLPLRQVDMPTTTGVSGSAGRTWQDVLTEHGTWQDVLDRYATWEDVLLDHRIGG